MQTVHRLDSNEGNVNFFLGNCFHSGLQGYYTALKEGEQHEYASVVAQDSYQIRFDEEMAKIKDQLSFLFSVGEPAFREAGALGFEMLQNYLEREPSNPLLDEVIAVEFRVNVAIRSPKGRRIGWLSVQADVVGRKDGNLVVVDHKTASREINLSYLDLDDQHTAEVFSWWKFSGEFPDLAIRNTAYKKSVGPPRLLKSGKLSKDKNQGTTYALYRQAIKDEGLDIGDYLDMLTFLQNREEMGEDPLFSRESTIRTPQQMAAFERDLYWEYTDMRRVAAHPEQAYPSPSPFNCPSCPVRVICQTIQDDGDVETIIKSGYIIGDPRR